MLNILNRLMSLISAFKPSKEQPKDREELMKTIITYLELAAKLSPTKLDDIIIQLVAKWLESKTGVKKDEPKLD